MGVEFGDQVLPTTFWAKVSVQPSGCWVWKAATNGSGYGVVRFAGRVRYAHRVAYAQCVAPIPAGLEVDHLCHVPGCVRPTHLRLATRKQNQENRSGCQRGSATGVRGVYVDARSGRFYVQVGHGGEIHHGGSFGDLTDAEAAAIALRNQLFTHNIVDRSRTP